MKTYYIIFTFSMFFLSIISCKKISNIENDAAQLLIRNAQHYFNAEILQKQRIGSGAANASPSGAAKSQRQLSDKIPLWDEAYTMRLKAGDAVVVPIKYDKGFIVNSNVAVDRFYEISRLTKLLIYQDKNKQYHAQLVTAFPDSTYLAKPNEDFKGLLFVDDWWGDPIHKYKFEDNQAFKVYDESRSLASVRMAPIGSQRTTDFYVCFEISGYNYSGGDTVLWTEPAGCSYVYGVGGQTFSNDNFTYPGSLLAGGDYGSLPTATEDSGQTLPIIPLNMRIYNGNNNIKNVKEYFKCFDNIPGSDYSYDVRLCVDQPDPGTNAPWGWLLSSDPVNVGHTFLILSETRGGETISRSVGFYPLDGVKPGAEIGQGVLNNDEIHDYNMSLSIKLDNGKFTTLLKFIEQGNNPGYLYNLNSNNCTTFALSALGAIGISSIPRTQGTWLGGGRGLNPGDLGEDIRTMPLAPNMTRTSISGAHLNRGTCN